MEPRDALLQTILTPLMPSTAPNQAKAFSILPALHTTEQSSQTEKAVLQKV